jgi:RimJ/RimL family protein N-acetyltransferase
VIELRPIYAEDADLLFPLIFNSPVTDALVWDGPSSIEEYRASISEQADKTRNGAAHTFVIVEKTTGNLAGSIGVRLYSENHRGAVGIWIGQPYQGRGHGTAAIRLAVEYGFTQLHLEKLEALIFVGNHASRRAFEKNGFLLEGTIRRATRKRGQLRDEWLLGLIPEEFRRA